MNNQQQIDLELSNDKMDKEISQYNNQSQYTYVEDQTKLAFQDMLQPITTMTKFNHKQLINTKLTNIHNYQNSSKQYQSKTKQTKDNGQVHTQINLQHQQTRKFRQYLNQKVNQLKKSQQIHKLKPNQKISIEKNDNQNKNNNKINQLRKIINNQQIKNNQNQKSKFKSITKQKQQNVIAKTIQRNQTSKSTQKTYKNNKQQKQQKKFSNSHSNLMIDDKDKNQIKRSVQITSKTPKLPLLKLPNIPTPNDKKDNSQKLIIHVSQKLTKNNLTNKQQQQLNTKNGSMNKVADTTNNFRIKKGSSNNIIEQKSNRINQKINKIEQKSNKIEQKSNRIDQKNQKYNNIDKQQKKNKGSQSPVFTSKNKKLRQDFIKLNQQQKILQIQIFKQHNQTKKPLQKMMKKYQLSYEQYQKYGIKRQNIKINQQNINQSKIGQTITKISSKKNITDNKSDQARRNDSPLKKQQNINSLIDEQILKIDNLLKIKQKQVKRLQSRIQKNAYTQFIKQMPENIMQLDQQQEAEEDQVKQLPSNIPFEGKAQMTGFGKNYSQLMNQMRKKKWGLHQRITFETHRQSLQKVQLSKVRENNSPLMKFNNLQNEETLNQENANSNRIAVNSRLKNLLLD